MGSIAAKCPHVLGFLGSRCRRETHPPYLLLEPTQSQIGKRATNVASLFLAYTIERSIAILAGDKTINCLYRFLFLVAAGNEIASGNLLT
jgi:hypothetical protein